MAWVFSFWPGYFHFGLGIFRGLGRIGLSSFLTLSRRWEWSVIPCRKPLCRSFTKNRRMKRAVAWLLSFLGKISVVFPSFSSPRQLKTWNLWIYEWPVYRNFMCGQSQPPKWRLTVSLSEVRDRGHLEAKIAIIELATQSLGFVSKQALS